MKLNFCVRKLKNETQVFLPSEAQVHLHSITYYQPSDKKLLGGGRRYNQSTHER